MKVGTADVAPPPPPPGEGLQALPEELTDGAAPGAAPAAAAAVPAVPLGPKAGQDAGAIPIGLGALAVLLNVTTPAAGWWAWRRGLLDGDPARGW